MPTRPTGSGKFRRVPGTFRECACPEFSVCAHNQMQATMQPPADLWRVVLGYLPGVERVRVGGVCRQWHQWAPIIVRPGRIVGFNWVLPLTAAPLTERLERLESLFNKIDRDQCRIRLALSALERDGREVRREVRHMEEMGKMTDNFMALWRLLRSSA